MKKLSFIILVYSAVVLAEEAKVPVKPGYQVMDMNQFKGIQNTQGSSMNVSLSCKSSSGVDLKRGDIGFDECIQKNSARDMNGKQRWCKESCVNSDCAKG